MVISDLRSLRKEFDKVRPRMESGRFHLKNPLFYAMGCVDEAGRGRLRNSAKPVGEVIVRRRKGPSIIVFRYSDVKEMFDGDRAVEIRDCEPLE